MLPAHRPDPVGRHAKPGRHRRRRQRRILGVPVGPVAGTAVAVALALGGGAVSLSASAPGAGTGVGHELTGAAFQLQTSARTDALSRADRSRALQQAKAEQAYARKKAAWEARQAATQRKLARRAAEALAKPKPIPLPKLPAGGVRLTEPAGSPLAGKTFVYVLPVSSGVSHDTFGETGPYWVARHTGQDFPVPTGTPIRAVSSGTVLETDWAGAYGNRIRILLDDGTEIWYCHLSSFIANTGQRVAAGQVVALSGSTGNSTGPHMHMEVHPHRQKTAVDPLVWLRAKGLKI